MKATVKIAPKTEYTEFIDRDLYRINYRPISVFLSAIKEMDWLYSKIVSVSNMDLYYTHVDLGEDCAEQDAIMLIFEYKWKERKIFNREIVALLTREDISRNYCYKII